MPTPNQLATAILGSPPGRRPWRGGPSITGCTRAVTPAMATWHPQWCTRSIWELSLHMAYWKYVVRRKLRGDKRGSFPLKGTNWFPVPARLSEAHWEQYKQILEDQHDHLRQVVAGLATTASSPVSPETVHLVSGVAAHDVYHAGQIRLLRSMYASRKK